MKVTCFEGSPPGLVTLRDIDFPPVSSYFAPVGARRKGKTLRTRTKARPLARNGGTRRLLDGVFELDRLFRTGRAYSLENLAQKLEASPRTVQRYVEVLRDRLGVEVAFDWTAKGYRYWGDRSLISAGKLTEEDLMALYVATPILAQYRGTPLEAEFERAFARLVKGLPRDLVQRLEPLDERVSVRATVPTTEDAERFRQVLKAVLGERQLELSYFSAHRGADTRRVVDPYALHAHKGRWYLVAYCHERRSVIPFHVSRISEVTETGTRFVRPATIDVDGMFSGSLGVFVDEPDAEPVEVVLRFDSFAARYVRETELHPSQELEPGPDGSLLMRLKLASFVELEKLVLGHGERVEVLAPEALRERIAGRLESALARYRTSQGVVAPSNERSGRRNGKKRPATDPDVGGK
ncbi:MAG: WYL domain-containing protein [Deltaproteobacteria bacterium]|nr:WYL domain-containing protein [Deltaproteobacteria bacterium]